MGDTEETVANQVVEKEVIDVDKEQPDAAEEQPQSKKGNPWLQDQMSGTTLPRSRMSLGRRRPSASTVDNYMHAAQRTMVRPL
jgi:hypothetical protein